MTRKGRRVTLIASALGVVAIALALVLYAMRDSIVFFYTPTTVAEKSTKPGARFRLGGLVKEGSLTRATGQEIAFDIVDAQNSLRVQYKGLLPDLFREGQGVVAEGMLDASGVFKADTVLAKHDETYMPREVADALKKQGHWQGEQKPVAAR